MKICDIHTHSSNSFDAENTVEEMCNSACNKGLFALAITDHCEAPEILLGSESEYGDFNKLIPKSNYETSILQDRYKGKIKILRGIELGEPMHNAECTKKALCFGDFDIIIASVHNLRNRPDFYYMDFKKEDAHIILDMYFDELLETASFDSFCTLAHLTYPLRYIKRDTGVIPNLSPYRDKIDLIYETLIKKDKALEINVSGLFKGLGETLPAFDEIKRYHDLGGKYITLGSDAHNINDVGRDIEKGIELAFKAGFKSYYIYENCCPYEITIE